MAITLTTLNWAPPFAQGLVRDLRIRWALEEAGIAYEDRTIDFKALKSPEFQALQPFRQVPLYEESGLTLFESGAILLHVGEKSTKLLPQDPGARARAVSWVFSALNSVEPVLQHLVDLDLFHGGEEWARLARPRAVKNAVKKLTYLSAYLEGREFLEDGFTAGDLMMTTVLRIPRHCELLAEFPVLDEYRARQEQRPAFVKALADHMAQFTGESPFG